MGFFLPHGLLRQILKKMSKLKIAIQKSGRLSEKSIDLLEKCGLKITSRGSKLLASVKNFPAEILFLRDDDIPQYVEQGVADLGILGYNEVCEKKKNITTVSKLGFARCRMSLAIPKEENYNGVDYFSSKRVATSYPNVLKSYFEDNNINAQIEEIGGSVEIAPSIGLSEAICDIVSTGSTLMTNGLKEVEVILESEAVLIANQELSKEKQEVLDKLLFRINAIKAAKNKKYILLNAPTDSVEAISEILPSLKSPTIMPLQTPDWCSLHSVIEEDDFWNVIDQIKVLGAEGILIFPIEKMIAQ